MGIRDHWTEPLYRATDKMDLDGALSFFAEDARVQIGNAEPTIGRAAAAESFAFVHQTVRGIAHEFLHVWDPDDRTSILESRVTFDRWGGDQVTIPCVAVLAREGDLVIDCRLYRDLEPLTRGQEAPVEVTGTIEVNPDGAEPRIGRDELWDALVAKAHDATRFVPSITECTVIDSGVDDDGRDWILRDAVISGEPTREHVTFYPKERVVFDRVVSRGMGQIQNIIDEGPNGELSVRFVFSLRMIGVPAGSPLHAALEEHARTGYTASIRNVVANLRAAAVGA